ncbi:MAG: hypothetical protein JKX74_07995 [Flavobacteriales bacterium]|nr:hypothetical protein [Flavobacteriales bacterium]
MKRNLPETARNFRHGILWAFLSIFFALDALSQTTLYSDDFESGTQWSYTTVTPSDNTWTVTSSGCPITASFSLQVYDSFGPTYCTYYNGDNCEKLAYKVFSSAGYQTLLLDFKWKCNGESGWDYGEVSWSTDGSTWTDLPTKYVSQSTAWIQSFP